MLQRQSTAANIVDVLDRVLDKGVVASVETYLRNAESVARILEPPR